MCISFSISTSYSPNNFQLLPFRRIKLLLWPNKFNIFLQERKILLLKATISFTNKWSGIYDISLALNVTNACVVVYLLERNLLSKWKLNPCSSIYLLIKKLSYFVIYLIFLCLNFLFQIYKKIIRFLHRLNRKVRHLK